MKKSSTNSLESLKTERLGLEHIVFDHDDTLVDPSAGGKLFDGVAEMLERLEEKGVKLYVWTARPRSSTVEFLKSLGIINRFELLSCGYENEPKPSVEGLNDILFDVDPRSVAVVGDSFADMLGAKNFGAFGLGALWSHRDPLQRENAAEILKEYGADDLAFSARECQQKLLAMISNKKE